MVEHIDKKPDLQHPFCEPGSKHDANSAHRGDLLSRYLGRLTTDERDLLGQAMKWQPKEYTDTKQPSDAVELGVILQELGMDTETQVAALLACRLDDATSHLDAISAVFTSPIAELVKGVGRMDALSSFSVTPDSEKFESKENLRRMLITMIGDVRVVVIKLAEQLQRLRGLKDCPGKIRTEMANTTLEIYAPLANRLGIWQLKWELEDLSLRYLDPETYKELAKKLAEKRVDRERYIEEFCNTLLRILNNANIAASVKGRPKHLFSIWKKMRKKDVDFDHIFDVRAVRILVSDVSACYAALGLVHTQWSPVAGEFDDYIATPKKNGYQSIHTAVVGPNGKIIEVQIRTESMHNENELGVAAHWRYKEGVKQSRGLDEKVLWLRQLLAWKDEVSDTSAFIDHLRNDVFDERVYVFTPKGNVIDLPKGGTSLDFAYAIHSEVGHRCRGAKVNGKIVTLNRPLNTGEQVEILTVKNGQPSRDWLNTHLGYLHTARARSRVQHWFKEADYDQNLSAGRTMLEKELQRLGIDDVRYDTLASAVKYKSTNDFLAAIGSGDLKISQALSPLRNRLAKEQKLEKPTEYPRRSRKKTSTGFKVRGVGNLLTNMAQCCNPLPGDAITGYITLGRGVTIHRQDCANLLRSRERNPERQIEVSWGGDEDARYPVDININAYDRSGLLADITASVANAKINLLAVDMRANRKSHETQIKLTLEITDIKALSRLLSQIHQIPNVVKVRRISQ